MARFLVQTIPNKLPELLINLSSQGPHLMGATLSTLLRAVHPGTIAMADFRRRLRPKVLTRHLGDLGTLHVISCSDEHIVLGIRHYGKRTKLILITKTNNKLVGVHGKIIFRSTSPRPRLSVPTRRCAQ